MTDLIPLHQLSISDFQSNSEVSYKEFKCKWTIKEFSKLPVDEELVSPDFELLPKCDCNLILYNMHQQLTLYLANKSDNNLNLECAVSIPDSMGKTLLHRTQTGILSRQKMGILDLTDDLEDFKTLNNNTLTIACDFKVFNLVVTQSSCVQVNDSSVYNGFGKLSLDLKNMYMKQKTNVTLIAIGGQVQAHKWLLCARSPVFEKILNGRMDENEHNTIKTGLKLPILKKLVDFLYCGEVSAETDPESIGLLYSAADKFEVLDLRQMCADSLMSKLTVDNAPQILVLVSRSKNPDLKIRVLDFIAKNFDRITDTDAWEYFVSHATKLAAETVKCYVKMLKVNNNTFTVSK